jgi:hypothetical protein
MKRPRLSEADKKSVALSPDEVVRCVVDVVVETTSNLGLQFDMIVEPCAGDGRLGFAVKEAAKKEAVLFDVFPRHRAVQKFDLLNDHHMKTVIKRLSGHRCLIVLNPPFNPKEKLMRICSDALGLEGAEFCVLVLPGLYLDLKQLDKLLPRMWHVGHIRKLESQLFDQPLLQKSTSELMLAIVFCTRKSYLRQTMSEEHARQHESFRLVGPKDNWHQALWTGAITDPVAVFNNGEKKTRPWSVEICGVLERVRSQTNMPAREVEII